MIETKNLTRTIRQPNSRRQPNTNHRQRRSFWFPWPKRRRKNHHHPHARLPNRTHQRRRNRSRIRHQKRPPKSTPISRHTNRKPQPIRTTNRIRKHGLLRPSIRNHRPSRKKQTDPRTTGVFQPVGTQKRQSQARLARV